MAVTATVGGRSLTLSGAGGVGDVGLTVNFTGVEGFVDVNGYGVSTDGSGVFVSVVDAQAYASLRYLDDSIQNILRKLSNMKVVEETGNKVYDADALAELRGRLGALEDSVSTDMGDETELGVVVTCNVGATFSFNHGSCFVRVGANDELTLSDVTEHVLTLRDSGALQSVVDGITLANSVLLDGVGGWRVRRDDGTFVTLRDLTTTIDALKDRVDFISSTSDAEELGVVCNYGKGGYVQPWTIYMFENGGGLWNRVNAFPGSFREILEGIVSLENSLELTVNDDQVTLANSVKTEGIGNWRVEGLTVSDLVNRVTALEGRVSALIGELSDETELGVICTYSGGEYPGWNNTRGGVWVRRDVALPKRTLGEVFSRVNEVERRLNFYEDYREDGELAVVYTWLKGWIRIDGAEALANDVCLDNLYSRLEAIEARLASTEPIELYVISATGDGEWIRYVDGAKE